MSTRPKSGMTWAEAFFCRLFQVFVWLDNFRTARKRTFDLVTGIIWGVIIFFLLPLEAFMWVPGPDWLHLPLVAQLIAIPTVTFLATAATMGLIPFLGYLRPSAAMRGLGLKSVIADKREATRLMIKCANAHSKDEKVRIICISGKHLFRESKMPFDERLSVPLHDLAKQGMLDVLMPLSAKENPTLAARFGTYSEDFRMSNSIKTMDRFIAMEVDTGKDFLRETSSRNTVHEHSMLCMWRVVIFSHHCFVQSYFPNVGGTHSYEAPVFVYERRDDQEHSYYALYVRMFDLIKGSAQPLGS